VLWRLTKTNHHIDSGILCIRKNWAHRYPPRAPPQGCRPLEGDGGWVQISKWAILVFGSYVSFFCMLVCWLHSTNPQLGLWFNSHGTVGGLRWALTLLAIGNVEIWAVGREIKFAFNHSDWFGSCYESDSEVRNVSNWVFSDNLHLTELWWTQIETQWIINKDGPRTLGHSDNPTPIICKPLEWVDLSQWVKLFHNIYLNEDFESSILVNLIRILEITSPLPNLLNQPILLRVEDSSPPKNTGVWFIHATPHRTKLF